MNVTHNLHGTPSIHNHDPKAHKKTIIDVRKSLKDKAQSTRDKPSQILQQVISNVSFSF